MNNIANEIRSVSRASRLWGVLVVLLGIFCLSAPLIPGLGMVLMVGFSLIVAGAAMLVYAFSSPTFGRGVLRFLFGVLALIAGAGLVYQPGAGLSTLTLFLAAWFFVDGIFTLLAALNIRHLKGWGWMAFSGLASIILGAMIYLQYPVSALWLIGVLVGVRLVFSGLTMILVGSAGTAVARRIEE